MIKTSALIMMLIVQGAVTLITVYLFRKVLKSNLAKKESRKSEDPENE